jgi:poly-gamma-glutamate synthesis protein (capsule biosynthesis protein)
VNHGADIVVGHHPHVPQGWEKYEGGYIFYSLGNFFLDYGEGGKYPKTDWGITLEVEFVNNEVDGICILPIERMNGSVDFMKRESALAAGWRKYLSRCSEVVSDDLLFRRYWNELAVELIKKKYEPYFSAAFFCPVNEKLSRRILWHLKNLVKESGRLVRYGNGEMRTMDDLVMLNLIRNESARGAIVTGLKERSGGLGKENSSPGEDLRGLMEWTGP